MDERLQSFPNPPRYAPFRPPQPSAGNGGGPEFFHSPHHGPPAHLPLPPHHNQLPPPPPDYSLPPRHPVPPMSPTPSITRIHHRPPLSSNVPFLHHRQQRLVDSPSGHHNRHRLDEPPPPVNEPAHLRRHGYELQHYRQQNRTHRTEEYPHASPRVSGRADVFDHNERHGGHRSPLRLPRFDNRSVQSDYGPTFRNPIDAPNRQPMTRMGLDREAHHRSYNRDRISPHFVRMGELRNQQERQFARDEEMKLNRRFRESDMVMRIRRDNGDRYFFRNDHGREGSNQRQMDSDRLIDRELMRPGSAETERWDQNSRNGVRSLIEVPNRGTDSRDGYSELSEREKTRVLDSGRYGNRDRREDAYDHSHSPVKRLERKSPFLRMQLDRPSFRNRNSSSITQRDRVRETTEYQNFRSREERDSSPMVSFKSNLLIVGPSNSRMVANLKPSPVGWKKTDESLPESIDQVLAVDSPGKQYQLKSEIEYCRENQLSSVEVKEDSEVSFDMKEAISFPVEQNISHGADPDPVSRKADSSSGNENVPQSPKQKDSIRDSSCSSSAKESSQNIENKRELMIPASPSSKGKIKLADKKVHISSDSVDNSTDIDYVRHFGDCKIVNNILPESSDQVLPVDSVGKQSEMISDSEVCSENELFSMKEEGKPKVSSIVKDVISVKKSIFNGGGPRPVPSKTMFSSDNEDMPHSPTCKGSDKDGACSDPGKESSLYIGKKRKLMNPLSSSDLGKENPLCDRVNISSLSVGGHSREDWEPENSLDKPVIESPSDLQDRKLTEDYAFGGSSIPSASRQVKCSSETGGSTTINFDEGRVSLDHDDGDGRTVRQDVGPSRIDAGSSVKLLEGHVSVANSADLGMPALDNRTIYERVAIEKTAAGIKPDPPGKMPNKINSNDSLLSSSISEEPFETNTPATLKGGTFGDSRKAKFVMEKLEKEVVSGDFRSIGYPDTYSQSSEDVKLANNEDLVQNQSRQRIFSKSLANGASGVVPEASDVARGEIGSLTREDHVMNVRRKILTSNFGENRVGDFLTLGSSSATSNLTQDETITGIKHHGKEELESSIMNENEVMGKPQEGDIPLGHRVLSGPDLLSPIKKRKLLSPVKEILHSIPTEMSETSSMEATPHDPHDPLIPSDWANASPQFAGEVEESSAEPLSRHTSAALQSKDLDLRSSFAGGGFTATDLVEEGCSVHSVARRLSSPDNIVLPNVAEFASLYSDKKIISSMDASDDTCDLKDTCNVEKAIDCGEESERPDGKKLTKCVNSKVQDVDMSCEIKIHRAEEGCLPVLGQSNVDDCAVNKSKNCISEGVSISQPSVADRICEKKLFFPDKVVVLPSVSKCNVGSSAIGLKANGPTEQQREISCKTAALPPLSHITRRTTEKSVVVSTNQQIGRNNEPRCASGNAMFGHSVFNTPSRKPVAHATKPRNTFISKPVVHATKPRTWRRTDALPSARPTLKKFNVISPPMQKPSHILGKVQNNSYIRKGNSLVRNPASASSEWSRANTSINQPSLSLYPSKVAANEMSKASSPLSNSGLSDSGFIPLGDCRSSPSSDSFVITETDPQRSPESLSRYVRNSDSDTDKKFEDQSVLSDANQATSDMSKVVYVKHKSNQLVAAPKHSEVPVQSVDGVTLSSKVYYKRKRNQLVRASSGTQTQLKTVPDSNSSWQRILKPFSCRSTSKGQANKVRKISGAQKLSLVWTLCGAQSQKKVTNSLRCENVLPHLLPWKRVSYISKCPSAFFSHKLLTSKRRNIIYTRSGFSLRRSKVVSVAGCSLKWSKSLEKRSKKAEKEASLAIHSMKKGKKDMDSGVTIGRNRNNVSRERIYRIGIFRYKMDPSRRTLQRISDEESSTALDGQHNEATKSSAVPKRLLIGHDEYVRIGNGNQLVRNPKRRTRIIASERVRWSLHTVRMRQAKRRKYCQFFTRFGKCNKGEGKCQYIHDESKVAVCTKFLNDSCSDPDCKLTHKVIPERMPDCSYFLQGLCSNGNCPYRHVNVNPKAAICGNFLKGYCDEGDECRKKHSYTCPAFEVKGECSEGSKCKLYHPKKGKYNGKRRDLNQYQKNSWGRYFDSGITALAESSEKEVPLHKDSDENMIVEDSSLADFISLEGYSDVEYEEPDYLANKQINLSSGGDSSRLQLGDDERIKPIRLLG